ncbi:MAG: outer membrane protein assembly factor BamA [Phycisphaerae bacterium]|nr:outer membrane protein assembly factor BamA [Phycisphaerae bacterium]
MRQGWKTIMVVTVAISCLWFIANPLMAEDSPEGLTIERIDVAGNVTLTRAQVLSVVRARPGRVFNETLSTEDVERIAKLDAAESAYYNTLIQDGKVVLTYVVVERNLVRAIYFKGNDKLKDQILAKELTIKRGDYLDIFAVRAGVDALTELYRKKGFPWATVAIHEADQASLMMGTVIYTIEEDSRPKTASVKFIGNKALPSRDLAAAIKTKKRKFLFFSSYYNAEQLEKDTQKLLEIYHKKAYLDAQVKSEVVFNDKKNKAFVTFNILEGPAYRVDSIHYTGNAFFDVETLRAETKLRRDYYYSEAWAEFDVKKIRAKYAEVGFVEARVQAARTFLPDARVRVEFEIEEGSRYRIGEVTITGNTTVQDRSIRRVLDEEGFTPGEWYNADIARGDGEGELEQIVRQTVVTESTKIYPVGDKPDTRDALVTIKEGQTGSIMLGAGVASDSGVIGQISLDQRNFDIKDTPESWSELLTGKAFRGAGQRFRISLNPGTVVSTYSVSFTEPYLYDKPIALNLGGSSFERGRESYDESRLAATLGFTKRYPNDWRRGVSFRAEMVDVSDLDMTAPTEIIDVEGNNNLFGTRFYIQKDTTDSRFRPSRGYNFDAGYEQVVGDFTFGILSATQRWYTTLYEDLSENKTVLETKVWGGSILGSAPAFEKFYVGGIGSMRGFEYRGISPRSGVEDDPVGSDWAVVGSGEIAVPLGSETFSWLFFSDVGTVESGGIRASVGTGVQILIPQFFGPVPMRFELAAPLMKDQKDETQMFSFSVGALF